MLNIEAYAFSTAPPPEGEPKAGPTKEQIYSNTIKDTDKPTIVRHGEGPEAHTYIFWKVEAFVARPNGRFHKPSVYFQPTASFKPASKPEKAVPEDDYLPSLAPTPMNLLQAFQNDPALSGVQPRLSAMRINKMAPSAAPVVREMTRPIRSGQRPLFRILPALIWRVRYAKVHTSVNDLSLLASLDLEVASYATYDVLIKSVNVNLLDGTVTPFPTSQEADTVHKPGDQLTFVYKLKPDITTDGTPSLGPKGHILTMTVSASVLMTPQCHPTIAIDWKIPVDFTPAAEHQNPNMLKAAHRLSNPSIKSPTNPDALPSHEAAEEIPSNAINITLTISGPPKVTLGEIFKWTVFIVNRSPVARKLAVLVLPKRKHPAATHASRPSNSSATSPQSKKELLAPAVVDENVVYAQQKSARTETADLICLTTDIRLGQLGPGSCFTADLKFLPLGLGVLGIESVRVVDLGSSESVDVRELPAVVCVGEGEE